MLLKHLWKNSINISDAAQVAGIWPCLFPELAQLVWLHTVICYICIYHFGNCCCYIFLIRYSQDRKWSNHFYLIGIILYSVDLLYSMYNYAYCWHICFLHLIQVSYFALCLAITKLLTVMLKYVSIMYMYMYMYACCLKCIVLMTINNIRLYKQHVHVLYVLVYTCTCIKSKFLYEGEKQYFMHTCTCMLRRIYNSTHFKIGWQL